MNNKFIKGISGNPNGRPKGVPNKVSTDLKEVIKLIVNTELEQLDIYLEQLTAKERLDFIVKLLPYVLPKQAEMEFKGNEVLTQITGMIIK